MFIELVPPSNSFLQKQILDAMISDLNIAFAKANSAAEKDIKKLTEQIIKRSAFYREFKHGTLRGEFGIRPSELDIRLDSILRGIVDDTHLVRQNLSINGNIITGGWLLTMGTDLFAALKGQQAGITRTEKGEFLPWLQWTLEEGNRLIIADFSILFRFLAGRSGQAIMIPNNTVGWRVPPSFAGTDYDNWITREILQHIDKYSNVVRRQIVRNFP